MAFADKGQLAINGAGRLRISGSGGVRDRIHWRYGVEGLGHGGRGWVRGLKRAGRPGLFAIQPISSR
jgi:hypothetical protein